MGDVTIFEQDGKVYRALSHTMPVKDLARETACGIREAAKIPGAKMKTVSLEEFKSMPFGEPKE